MRRPRLAAAAFACILGVAFPGSATAEDPVFVDWSSLLPGLSGGYDPSSENDCKAGRIQCVDGVIREMYQRFEPLAEDCNHDSAFALTYLRTTEEYRRAAVTPDFFQDVSFVNHEDAVFASYYFEAYDDWHKNRRSEVPQAWAIAFEAADGRQVSALGNLFLGMSAHINRDLPYVFEAIGMTKPDGSSRKPDHDKVNTFLNRVSDELMPELARRFDPTVDDGNAPTTVDDMLSFQAIAAMRESAWRNGERLTAADTPAERAAVAQSIEEYAASEAQAIRAATAYPPLSGGSAARDAYCAVHHDD